MLAHFYFILISFQDIKGEKPSKCMSLCPNNWEMVEDKCYLWKSTPKSWPDAEQFCNENDGHLASVTNLKIQNYLQSKVEKNDSNTFLWIGGTDRENEGKWGWIDGNDWNFTHWATKPTQQPNDFMNEDCLQIYDQNTAQDGWNDQRCSTLQSFVCSRPICPASPSSSNTHNAWYEQNQIQMSDLKELDTL